MDVLLARWWRTIELLARVERAIGVLLISTIVVTMNHSSPLVDGKRSKYSVTFAFAL